MSKMKRKKTSFDKKGVENETHSNIKGIKKGQ